MRVRPVLVSLLLMFSFTVDGMAREPLGPLVQRSREKPRRGRNRQRATPEPAPVAPPAPSVKEDNRAGQLLEGGLGCLALVGLVVGFAVWFGMRKKAAAGGREVWRAFAAQHGWPFQPGVGQQVGTVHAHVGGVSVVLEAGFSQGQSGSYPFTKATTQLPRLAGDFEVSQKALLGGSAKTGDAALDQAVVVTGADAMRIPGSPVRDALLRFTAATDRFFPVSPRTGTLSSTNERIIDNPVQLRAIVDAHAALAHALHHVFSG